MVLDAGLNYVCVNGEYERATMRPEADFVGRFVFDMFPNEGESGRRLKASFQRVLDTGEVDTLAYLHYDIPVPEKLGGGFERRYWTCVHTPLFDVDGAVSHIVQNTVDVTELARLKEATSLPFRTRPGEAELIERAQQADRMRESLLAESADFRRLFQQAPSFIAVMSGPDHVFTFVNDAYTRLIGGRAVIGLTVREALPEIRDQGFDAMLDDVYRNGTSRGGEGVRVMLQAPGAEARETFLDFTYEPIRDDAGAITGVFVQGMDRTEAVRTQERQRLLLAELNHRVKNTLATVQSIARQTLRSARDTVSAGRDFEARIIALSKAHDLLSASEWAHTELSALVCQELSVHGRQRVEADGPAVVVDPKAAIAFAMLIHELATNAAKYGALSIPTGRLDVKWHREGAGADGVLTLDWVERGGPPPPPSPRERKGFGSRMIDRVVTGELGGTFDARYDPEGFACRIAIPMSMLGTTDDVAQ